MFTPIDSLPEGLTGFAVRGTVLARDVGDALRHSRATDRLAVRVEPSFDGYLVELVEGLHEACAGGALKACALVLPDAMTGVVAPKQDSQFRVFPASKDAEAMDWLSAA